MKKTTIGIIGQGFVGTAVNEGLAKHYYIHTYDIAKKSTCKSIEELSTKSETPIPVADDTVIAVLAAPTVLPL